MMADICVYMTFLLAIRDTVSVSCGSKTMHRLKILDNQLFSIGFLQEKDGVHMKLDCFTKCYMNTRCNLASHNKQTKQCRLHYVDQALAGQGLPVNGWKHYTYEDTCQESGETSDNCWAAISTITETCLPCVTAAGVTWPKACIMHQTPLEPPATDSYIYPPFDVADGMSIILQCKYEPSTGYLEVFVGTEDWYTGINNDFDYDYFYFDSYNDYWYMEGNSPIIEAEDFTVMFVKQGPVIHIYVDGTFIESHATNGDAIDRIHVAGLQYILKFAIMLSPNCLPELPV